MGIIIKCNKSQILLQTRSSSRPPSPTVWSRKPNPNSTRVVLIPMKLLPQLRNGKIANAAAVILLSSLPLLFPLCGTLPDLLSCSAPELLALFGPWYLFTSLLSEDGGPSPPAASTACPSAEICADAAAELYLALLP